MDALLEAMAVKICKDECPVYDPYDSFSPFRSGPRWKCFIDRAKKQLETPEMKRVIDAARAEGSKTGQETMRDRAASLIAHPQCHFAEPQDAADAIRALPIEEPPAS
ncbi:hypothetical protein [Rhizobium leguminosarum]|uniref:hypothetical protein n=1 Tax=Rhizobium leguminosarum TaxID=384 RepID=UPI00161DA32F|nr:hypothetical protein [Rhizobium leguminosarum]MBB4345185.1 hypothetical protein [Rhizobium leguminosarum]MBB6298256.1 hypothetical protein [Rhizobium leguminosarum]